MLTSAKYWAFIIQEVTEGKKGSDVSTPLLYLLVLAGQKKTAFMLNIKVSYPFGVKPVYPSF